MAEVARRQDGGLAASSAPPSQAEWNVLQEQARVVAKSGLAPKAVATPEKIATIALKGRELSLPMMQALSHIAVIDGKPTLSAELMVALVQRAGHKLRVLETSAQSATVEGVRADDPGHRPRVTFSMADAKTAGVAGKQVWKAYPAAMLRARAISALCRFQFADVLAGCSYVPEELGAEVDEEGQVVVPEAPARAIQAHDDAQPEEDEHERLLRRLEDEWQSLPEPQRPEWEVMYDYARAKRANARRTLEQLQTIRYTVQGNFDDPEEPAEDDPELVTEDQLAYILDIVGELYGEVSDRHTGQQVYERQIGQSLTTLTRDEATVAIESLDREWRELRSEEARAE